MLWIANIDIQFVAESSLALAHILPARLSLFFFFPKIEVHCVFFGPYWHLQPFVINSSTVSISSLSSTLISKSLESLKPVSQSQDIETSGITGSWPGVELQEGTETQVDGSGHFTISGCSIAYLASHSWSWQHVYLTIFNFSPPVGHKKNEDKTPGFTIGCHGKACLFSSKLVSL